MYSSGCYIFWYFENDKAIKMKNKVKKPFSLIAITVAIGGIALSLAPKAKALELTHNVEQTGTTHYVGSVECLDNAGVRWQQLGGITCATSAGRSLVQMADYDAKHYKQGHFYTNILVLQYPQAQNPNILWYLSTDQQYWQLISIKEIASGEGAEIGDIINNNPNYLSTFVPTYYAYIYEVTLQAKVTGTLKWVVGNGVNSIGFAPGAPPTYYSIGRDIIEWKSINQNIDSVNQQQQQQGQQAQDAAINTIREQDQNAQQETQGMFQTIGDIVNAFKDTPPSADCTITGTLGKLGNINMNFCQGNIEPLRPIIRASIYLGMSIATFKLLMWIIGAIAGLANYVQTGNEEGTK